MKPQLSTLFAVGLSVAAIGCAQDQPWQMTESTTSSLLFSGDDGAYNVMIRDCAYFACHGSSERLFQVWGPKRHRLIDMPPAGTDEHALIDQEMQQTFNSAIGFVDINDPGNSLLLRKPLDSQAGGTGHLGLDKYGRNVYRSASSPGYVRLAKWIYDLQVQAKVAKSDNGS